MIQFLLETAFQRNYRKRGKDLFEPVIFNKHFYLYFFKKACTISEFILGHCQNATIDPDDMFTLNNQLMLNYKKHLDIWDTNGKINPDQYEELKHTVQLTSMNFHIAYEISKMECKQESLNQMNLSVLPSMNDYNLWADDRQKSIHKLIHFLLETAFQRNYRKRGKDLFEPVIFNKHFTYTFKKACTISEFYSGPLSVLSSVT